MTLYIRSRYIPLKSKINLGSYSDNIRPIEELFQYVSGHIDEGLYLSYFQRICDEYDVKARANFKANHWENATHRKLLQVFERIKFTSFLDSQITDDFRTRLYYPQIRTYLILTCFDQLGQPDEWRFFPDWMKSKKKRQEREDIIANLTYESLEDFTMKIYRKYNEKYGVKRAFTKFIKNVIDEPTRVQLLESMKISIRQEPDLQEVAQTKEEMTDLKIKYLYKIRNDFTHNTYSKERITNLNTTLIEPWQHRETFFKGSNSIIGYHIATVRQFHELLKITVFNGIANRIKNGM